MGGKYFMLEENAHHGPVNMVKVTDCIKAPFCIISVGEDGLIKIWDSSMDIIYAHDVRELDFMGPIKEGSFGIQSLDIYACRKQRAVPELLLGLRSGDIISATLIVESRAAEQLAIKCEYIPLIREQSSLNKSKDRRRVHFALHPFHPIMASISDDKTIRIRDIHKHTLYSLTNLGKGNVYICIYLYIYIYMYRSYSSSFYTRWEFHSDWFATWDSSIYVNRNQESRYI